MRPAAAVLREIRDYSIYANLSALFYNALLYLPQLFISRRLGAVEIGTFGLILLFLGPLSLVNASVRT